MDRPTIKVSDNGPYRLKGDFSLIDVKGQSFPMGGNVALCRCGYSDEKPFCDGTHEVIQFKSTPRAKELMVEV